MINVTKLVKDIKFLESEECTEERRRLMQKYRDTAWRDFETRKQISKELEKIGNSHKTKLYSLRAHLRGRLHMTKINGATLYEQTGVDCWRWWYNRGEDAVVLDERRHMFRWRMEDQARLVEEVLAEYTIQE